MISLHKNHRLAEAIYSQLLYMYHIPGMFGGSKV